MLAQRPQTQSTRQTNYFRRKNCTANNQQFRDIGAFQAMSKRLTNDNICTAAFINIEIPTY